MSKIYQIHNLHLSISILIVVFAAVIYGFYPQFFNIQLTSVNEFSLLKAVMGLYLSFATLWLIGIFSENYWKTATICNALFMLGLGFGRIISFIFDGLPSVFFVIGTFGEFFLGFYALVQLKKHQKKKAI